MSFPDPRTRSKQSFASSSASIRSRQSYVSLALAHGLHTISLLAAKQWLLERDASSLWLAVRLLQLAAVGVLGWTALGRAVIPWRSFSAKQWGALSSTCVILFLRQISFAVGLHRLSPIRFVIMTQTYPFWLPHLISPTSILVTLLVGSAFPLAWFFDSLVHNPSDPSLIITYTCVAIYVGLSYVLQKEQLPMVLSLGEWPTISTAIIGAGSISVVAEVLALVTGWQADYPPLPWFSVLSTLPALSLASIYLVPRVNRSLNASLTPHSLPANRYLLPTVLSTLLPVLLFGRFIFRQTLFWSDAAIAGLLYIGTIKGAPSGGLDAPTRTSTTRALRSYLKVIMEKDDSRKIFYFLMVNLAYMVIQMMWGFWTNSLGLVSDAIHMLFDCFSVGVGLMASIMATWPPNESFTYGYGRIETISGFANGIFLILISIFIVFEAVQRIVDPPEMGNFQQLLIVSTMGLAVNLFGMFAIGGHHHHGHSHSHSHSHGPEPAAHGHSHDEKSSSHHAAPSSHGHGHAHDDHGHGHAHDDHGHGHAHDEHSHDHTDRPRPRINGVATHQGHSHDQGHRHSHDDHDGDDDHSSHDHDHSGHEHDHDHGGHSHGPQEIILPPHSSGRHAEGHDHDHSHSHANGHGHSHDASPTSGADIHSPITPSYRFDHDMHVETYHPAPQAHAHDDHGHGHNMRGVFLHVMADTLGSVGVIISTILIQMYGWTGFDPIASLFIAILIAASVVPLVIDCGRVLSLDVGSREADVRQALQELSTVEGVSSYSEARFWPKDDSAVVGSIHVRLTPSASSFDPTGPHSVKQLAYTNIDRVVDRVERLLKSRIPGLDELAIQVEGA